MRIKKKWQQSFLLKQNHVKEDKKNLKNSNNQYQIKLIQQVINEKNRIKLIQQMIKKNTKKTINPKQLLLHMEKILWMEKILKKNDFIIFNQNKTVFNYFYVFMFYLLPSI